MKDVQKALGDATNDADLPKNAYNKLKAMDKALAKGKQIQDDCSAIVRKLRAMIYSTEEQLRVYQKQALFYNPILERSRVMDERTIRKK
ncbi:putative polygalacturonate 4-alpha-galacturonosyltransferase [Helianthus annuus]|nr:putative polygalacturonate 4-alpha-galacturonosyltransferase [Helianthus annuus]